jgi:uncharacterized protein
MTYQSLDAIRGIAVMGILLMNIISFAMPETAYLNPTAFGHHSPGDWIMWAVMAILVDGKFRGLFSILFGASMLLIYERAEAGGADGRAVHMRRMVWLLAFGVLHYHLIWNGDILALYALCGMLGMFLLDKDADSLRRATIWLLGINFVFFSLLMIAALGFRYQALLPEADPALLTRYLSFANDLGDTKDSIAKDIALHQGSWFELVWQKVSEDILAPFTSVMISGVETLGLMALGMMLFRNGFLTGDWTCAHYQRVMRWAYWVGIPPLILIEIVNAWLGFDPVINLSILFAFTAPFRVAVAIGHAALAMIMIKRFSAHPMMARIEAAGKAAFTNYLGTSILMTAIFYGWGLGQYGHWSRIEIYAVVPFAWALMLLWSKPWLERFSYGPFEWVWRCLARWEWIPLRQPRSA